MSEHKKILSIDFSDWIITSLRNTEWLFTVFQFYLNFILKVNGDQTPIVNRDDQHAQITKEVDLDLVKERQQELIKLERGS